MFGGGQLTFEEQSDASIQLLIEKGALEQVPKNNNNVDEGRINSSAVRGEWSLLWL